MISKEAIRAVAEGGKAHNPRHLDLWELNYWARKIRFQRLKDYYLVEC